MSQPLISVIVTCFNRERYLGEAIDSILAQTRADYEIVLVDDGSTDGSARVAARYGKKLRYLYQDNQGAGAAKNTGAEHARGRYLAFLDSDDLWTPDKLDVQLGHLASNPDVALLYAHGSQFISPELPSADKRRLHCPVTAMPAPITGTLMLERRTFLQVGPFRTDLKVGIDVEWHLRAKALGLAMSTLPNVLLHRRIHPSNSGFSHRAQQKQHADILKAHLDRMRRRAQLEMR